jgi:hypothetical protein
MDAIDPDMVRMLLEEHGEIRQRLATLSAMADEIAGVAATTRRLEWGARINREANDFFACYLAHMNKEEVTIVPAMKQHFTDDQMRAMQGAIMGKMPPERLVNYLRWMLPALSMAELTGLLVGVKQGAPPELLQQVNEIGTANVDTSRWALVRKEVGF